MNSSQAQQAEYKNWRLNVCPFVQVQRLLPVNERRPPGCLGDEAVKIRVTEVTHSSHRTLTDDGTIISALYLNHIEIHTMASYEV